MKSPFLQNLNELPRPVWLFGAYGMTRLGEWSFALLMQCVNGNLRLDGLFFQRRLAHGVLGG